MEAVQPCGAAHGDLELRDVTMSSGQTQDTSGSYMQANSLCQHPPLLSRAGIPLNLEALHTEELGS